MSFDVVDVLAGLTTLAQRSQTLGGSVPLRVAQACVPLLEGNAWGKQITLHKRITLHRRLGRWSVASFDGGEQCNALLRGGLPMLGATLAPAWRPRLDNGVLVAGRSISLFTGLFVRPHPGHRLRQSATANRRSFAYEIGEAILDDTSGFVPLVLDIVPRADVDHLILEGEIATLGILPEAITVSRATLSDAPDIVRAHTGFYDAEYFATKRDGQTARKYRDELKTTRLVTSDATTIAVTIVEGGPRLVEPGTPPRAHRRIGVVTGRELAAAPDRLVVRNAVAFEATFDGLHVTVEPDRVQLERFAAEIRERWGPLVTHEGSLLYLAKYFTPHPPGEPHFFTKPPALIATPPGTSTLISGARGVGFDVMRGVVRTDTFHAVPSVFHLWQPGRTIAVNQGDIVAELFPIVRTNAADDELQVERAGAAAL
ncbi:MAG: hypothetical protein ACKV2T_20565 [Kofleriaceae bacterium]